MLDELLNYSGLTKRQLTGFIIVGAILLYVIFGLVWWFKVWQNPYQVFWSALRSNLSTNGVTRHINETVNGQTLNETVRLSLGTINQAVAQTTLTQNGNVVKTQSIGTPTADFTRYTLIKTSLKGTNKKPLNFNSIINVWGKASSSYTAKSYDPLNHLFGQTVLGIVPLGNLTGGNSSSLMSQMQTSHAFLPDYHVTVSNLHHVRVYVYDVKIEPVAYAALMQSFSKDMGLGSVPEFNPNNYVGSSPILVQFAINPISHQLLKVSYTGSNHTEVYSGYGQSSEVSLPTRTIPTSKLQSELSKIK